MLKVLICYCQWVSPVKVMLHTTDLIQDAQAQLRRLHSLHPTPLVPYHLPNKNPNLIIHEEASEHEQLNQAKNTPPTSRSHLLRASLGLA